MKTVIRWFYSIISVCLLFSICISSYALTFNHDEQSSRIANASLEAMGGRQNYDNTRYMSWVFFGNRFHVWDKHSGNIRIEYGQGNLILMNVHSKTGRVWEDGLEIKDEAVISEKMQWAYNVWINDSYWVVMPYKLHDPGVTLTYTREDKSKDGRSLDVLTMTFDNVGVTPENKYEVFFDRQSKLVTAFAFFPKVSDTTPRFNMPWVNWKKHGNIMLSDSRGDKGMAPISVFEELPQEVFTHFSPTQDVSGKAIPGAIIK